jgi:hypothetical protein
MKRLPPMLKNSVGGFVFIRNYALDKARGI